MTDLIREQSKWAREKTKVVVEYDRVQKDLLSTVAGRGFSVVPGFLYDIQNRVETDVKFKISDLSYAILVETVERELKNAGLAYDLLFKSAQLAWEIEKQGLLTEWDKEYSILKQNMKLGDELVERLVIALYLRRIYLLEQKTAIELEAEGYKNQIAGLGLNVAEAESDLAAQKVLTANKKLEIIPILELILAQELLLLDAYRDKNVEETRLIEAQERVADKKEGTLLPKLQDLAWEMQSYAEAVTEQTGLQIDIAETRRDDVLAGTVNTEKRVEVVEAQGESDLIRVQISVRERAIDEIRKDLDFAIARQEKIRVDQLRAKEDSVQGTINDANVSTNHAIKSAKDTSLASELTSKQTYYDDTSQSDSNKNLDIATYHAESATEVAVIQSVAKITSALTHLLGQ
jgi:hypothetical protein